MPRPIPDEVVQGIEGWDASIEKNFDLVFEDAIPVKQFASVAALPTVGDYVDCVAVVIEAGKKRQWFISDGVTWISMNRREPRKLDIVVGAEVPDVIKFTLQLQDIEGNDLAERRAVKVWMAETAFGPADATALNSMVVVAPAVKFFNHATEYAEFQTHTDGIVAIDVDVTGGKTKFMIIDTGFAVFSQTATWAP
jgi:hypothetical protein